MTISGNVPSHLLVAARTGFLTTMRQTNYQWNRIAGKIDLTAASQKTVDLGAAPMPVRAGLGGVVQGFIEKAADLTPLDWEILVNISYNAVKDDQTGTLLTKVKAAGQNFNKHINKLVFQYLNAGDASTYGLAYDGQTFFSDTHADAGAEYVTAQDNKLANAFSLDSYTTAYIAASLFRDDRGELVEHTFDTLVVPPALEYVAVNITGNPQALDTASRELNPYSGRVSPIVSGHLDATAYILLATGEAQKPLYLVMREEPNLQDAWFDPNGPDGGLYYFKYYGRYNVIYGDWRLALMGAT